MRFICELYPNSDIHGCKFKDGVYETFDESAIQRLKSVPWVKVCGAEVSCDADIVRTEEVEGEDALCPEAYGDMAWDKDALDKKTKKELQELLDMRNIAYNYRDSKDKLIARFIGE